MAKLVELKFEENTKSFLANADGFDLKKGDRVIADYSDSHEVATVLSVFEGDLGEDSKPTKIFKKFDENDQKTYDQVLSARKVDFQNVQEAVKKFELSMKLVDVRHSFDMSKLFVSYSAESRVDFRDLVKYLAGIFKTRVELRQISTREEAKMVSGCGICGKPFCCRTFSNLPQTTIKMAKTQGLALNPNKINGVCGKLLCCLAYENSAYQSALEKMPPLGSRLKTPKGEGEVVFQDLLQERVSVKIFEDEQNYNIFDFDLKDLEF